MSPRTRSKLVRRRRRRPVLEQLDARICLAVDAVFDAGVLTIIGSRDADNVSIDDNGRGVVSVVDRDSRDRWQFRGVDRIVVDTGAGDDRIHVSLRGGPDSTVPELDVTAGEGDDEVAIGLLLPAVQKVREAAAKLHVDLGDGHDRLQVRAAGINNLDLDVTAGEGDDNVLIGLLLPAVQKVREAASRVDVVVDLGGGNDRLQLTGHGMSEADLDLSAGEGDDDMLIGLLLPAVQKVREAASRVDVDVDLGGGNDRLRLTGHGMSEADLDITAGEGDDELLIGLLVPAVQKVRESAARMNIDLGGGNDHLRLNTTGIGTVDLDVTAGEGDDAILIGLLLPAVQKVRESAARLHVDLSDLGEGADILHVGQRGYETFETDIISDEDDIIVLPGSGRGPDPGSGPAA